MEISELVLEYVKAILTPPLIFAVILGVFIFKFSEDISALVRRVAKIKLPGGAEVSTHQSNRNPEEKDKAPPEPGPIPTGVIPSGLTVEQKAAVEKLLESHVAIAYLWEYRYLNYFLVRGTQLILDWLSNLSQPVTYAYFDSVWLPLIPSANERQAIITALENHHLVVHDEATNMLTVTPKGREYREWRGPVPESNNFSEEKN